MEPQTRRVFEFLLIIFGIGGFTLWFSYAFQNQTIPIPELFFNYSFFLFIISTSAATLIHLYNWRDSINSSESVIFEIVVYRKMTPINALANKLRLSKDEVFEILQKMIINSKIIGQIKEGIFYTTTPRTPFCSICKEQIVDSLRLITCPFCHKPYHKDHIIGYLSDVDESCPNCKRALTLSDLYLD
jgi:hypothetical protein